MRESSLMRSPMSLRNAAIKCAGALLALAAFAGTTSAAEESEGLKSAQTNVMNIASLQRGARTYFNYCSGCHSIKYMNYARLSDDLKLSPEEVLTNFAFTGARIGDQIVSNMPAAGSQQWFGKTPPDLSLE